MTEHKSNQPFPGDDGIENAQMIKSIEGNLQTFNQDEQRIFMNHLGIKLGLASGALALAASQLDDVWKFILRFPPIIF